MNECQGLACSGNDCLGLAAVAMASLQLFNCLSGWNDRAICLVQDAFAALHGTCTTVDGILLQGMLTAKRHTGMQLGTTINEDKTDADH